GHSSAPWCFAETRDRVCLPASAPWQYLPPGLGPTPLPDPHPVPRSSPRPRLLSVAPERHYPLLLLEELCLLSRLPPFPYRRHVWLIPPLAATSLLNWQSVRSTPPCRTGQIAASVAWWDCPSPKLTAVAWRSGLREERR